MYLANDFSILWSARAQRRLNSLRLRPRGRVTHRKHIGEFIDGPSSRDTFRLRKSGRLKTA